MIDYRAQQIDDQSFLLASSLPHGRIWSSKWDETRVFGRLIKAFSQEIRRLFLRCQVLVVQELDITKTNQLILEWEESAGIPDQCFDRAASLIERRRRVEQKLNNFGDIITSADVVNLLAEFGENIEIVPGNESNASQLGFGAGPFSTQELKEIRHTIAVRVESDAQTFPLTFPIPFSTASNELLQCLVQRVVPANVNVQFFFNQNLALPF